MRITRENIGSVVGVLAFFGGMFFLATFGGRGPHLNPKNAKDRAMVNDIVSGEWYSCSGETRITFRSDGTYRMTEPDAKGHVVELESSKWAVTGQIMHVEGQRAPNGVIEFRSGDVLFMAPSKDAPISKCWWRFDPQQEDYD